MFLLGFILPVTLNFLNLGDCFLSHVREVFIYYLFKYFPMLFLSFPSGTSVMWLLVCLMLFQSSLKLSSYLFILLSLSYCTVLISTILSFSSLICSSPSFILLSIPSVVFLFQLLCCSSLFVCYSDSEVAQLCPTLCGPVNCSPPGSSVHGILQIRIWSGLPFPSPGDLPDSGIKPSSPALQADALTSEPPGKPFCMLDLLTFC